MLTKSNASPYILTLFLSLVSSYLFVNILDCKLKLCIRNAAFVHATRAALTHTLT
jgi:hypothetical protein